MTRKASKPRKSSKAKPKTPQEEAAQKIRGGVVVTLVDVGGGQQNFDFQVIEGSTIREAPTLLRQAANQLEKQLVGE